MMVPYLLLCLLPIWAVQGQGQTINRECHSCPFKFLSTCFTTTQQIAQCQENSYCGVTNYALGGTVLFARYGCIESATCNRTESGTTVLRSMSANSTCCNTNFCNGGFTARAPHLAVLGSLSVFLLYITS